MALVGWAANRFVPSVAYLAARKPRMNESIQTGIVTALVTGFLVHGLHWFTAYLKSDKESDAQEHDQTRTAYSDTIRDLRKQISDLREAHRIERDELKLEMRGVYKALDECKQAHLDGDRERSTMASRIEQLERANQHRAFEEEDRRQ